ncbi:hypothetical protein MMC26_006045 [Xylographa opegraphella]|nr:hypothetical protein [Xylographa opegraphella]
MPRDLFPNRQSQELTLTESPEAKTPRPINSQDEEQLPSNAFTIVRDESDDREQQLSNTLRRSDEKIKLHPYVQLLSLSDLEACVALEAATFPEHERASREKFIYRLTTCPTLSLGLFSSTTTLPTPATQAAFDAARPPDSSTPSHRAVLLGHVIGTLTDAPAVTDASMEIPQSLPSHPDHLPTAPPPDTHDTEVSGHRPLGRTIAIHSVCILPTHQNLGLGKTLLKAYMQRMESSGIADRIALLAHPELVGWYMGKFGFEDRGESKAMFGGGGWRELVRRKLFLCQREC